MSVTVYTKPNCVQCDATKRHLDRLGIEYGIVDITVDTEAFDMLIDKGFKAAPVVIADGSEWAGYQPDKIEELAN